MQSKNKKKIAGATVALIFASIGSIALASTISAVTPNPVTSYTESFSFDQQSDTLSDDLVVFNPNGVALGGAQYADTDSHSTTFSIQGLDNWIDTPNVHGVYTLLFVGATDACITSGYDGHSDDLTNCMALNPSPIETFSYTSAAPPSSFPHFEILSAATSSQLIAAIASSSQRTIAGGLLKVLAVVAGIALAFYAVYEIKKFFPK